MGWIGRKIKTYLIGVLRERRLIYLSVCAVFRPGVLFLIIGERS